MVVTLRYAERNVYENHEEKQIYTCEDFVAGIGGMIVSGWPLVFKRQILGDLIRNLQYFPTDFVIAVLIKEFLL